MKIWLSSFVDSPGNWELSTEKLPNLKKTQIEILFLAPKNYRRSRFEWDRMQLEIIQLLRKALSGGNLVVMKTSIYGSAMTLEVPIKKKVSFDVICWFKLMMFVLISSVEFSLT